MIYPDSDASLQQAHNQFRPLALPAFVALDIKPRGMVLDPIIPERGLVMIYAARGTGKTHVALGIAHAVASGTGFLRWLAAKPRRVLLVDAHYPGSMLVMDRRNSELAIMGGGVPGTCAHRTKAAQCPTGCKSLLQSPASFDATAL
jgi:hypothetical protein